MAAPPTPQRKSTFRSRVGGAIRRSSTAFSIPGLPNRGSSSTPPPPQDSDTASIVGSVSGKLDREGSTTSLNKIDTTPPQPPVPISSAPSPIPESPAREAAATAAEPQLAAAKAPSPLANEVPKADTASKQGSTPPRSVSGTPPPPEPVFTATPPPRPSVISERQPSEPAVVAPVLTDEPEEIPTQPAAAPSAPSSRPSTKSGTPPPPASVPPSAPVTPAALSMTTSGYFGDIPRSTTPLGLESDSGANVWADHRGVTSGSESGSDAPRGRILTSNPSKSSLRPRDSSVASSHVVPPLSQSRTVSRKPSGVIQSRQTELAGVTRTWSSSSDLGFASMGNLP